MAYAYSAIDDLLSNQQPAKQDIFAAPQPGDQGMVQTQPTGGPEPVKTSTEGEGASGGAVTNPAAGSTSSSAGPVSDTSKSDRAAAMANVGKTSAPAALTGIGNQLTARAQGLQDEANSYVTAQKANQSYAMQAPDYEKAIAGDKDKFAGITNLLTRQNINSVDEFKPTNVTVKDSDLLSTDAGLRNLIQRGQKPTYTAGQAQFDLGALKRTPSFQENVRALQTSQADLQKQAADYQAAKQKEVEDYGTQALQAAQTGARDYLGRQSAAIDAANEAEAAAKNKILAQYRTGGAPDSAAAIAAAKDAVLKRLQQTDPRSTRFVKDAVTDPAAYASVHGDYGRDDFVSPEEAQRFNSIMQLLGQGDVRSASSALGPDYSYDQDAIQNKLLDQTSKLRSSADTADTAELKKIIAAAQLRADQDDARRKIDPAKVIASEAAKARAGIGNAFLPYFQGDESFDASPYFTQNAADLGASDVYSQKEADRLNWLAQDLGRNDHYQAGTKQLGQAGYTFNAPAYQAALTSFISSQIPRIEQQRAAEKALAADVASQKQYNSQIPVSAGTLAIPAPSAGGAYYAGLMPDPRKVDPNAPKYVIDNRKYSSPSAGTLAIGR